MQVKNTFFKGKKNLNKIVVTVQGTYFIEQGTFLWYGSILKIYSENHGKFVLKLFFYS